MYIMHQGLEFHGEWDNKKRKNNVLDSFSNSSRDEWDSGSCTEPALKHRKSQLGCQDEVGNDHIQFMGREIFDSTTCIPMENVRIVEDGLYGEKDLMVEIHGGKSINHLETSERQGKHRICDRADEKRSHGSLTLNENRMCMLTIISELKERKEKMLIWLQQEVQKIMNDGCGGSGVRIGNGGQMEFEEQHGSGANANSTGITVLGNGSGEIDFGGETSATDVSFVNPNGDSGRKELGFRKENESGDRMCMEFGSQKSAGQSDVGMGGRSNSEGMQLGNQRDAIVGLRNPNVLPGEMAFGAEQTQSSCGIGLNHASRGSGMVFAGSHFDRGIMDSRGRGGLGIRNSLGLVNSQTLVDSARGRQVDGMQISGEGRTPDLIGMHNQSLQLQSSAPMMWNDVVENPSDASHGIHFGAHNKLGNRGIGSYRGLVCSGAGYDNSSGMMNSTGLQVAASSLGMDLPNIMQNMGHGGLNSLSMQPFLGMQNQAVAQNFSGKQNFLGLSMNGSMGPVAPLLEEGINTHVFPGVYHNDQTRHVLAAKFNPLPGSYGIRGRPYKKGSTGRRTDELELNT